MAVNFGDTQIQTQVTPDVQIENPVQDNSMAIFAQGLQGATQAAGGVLGGLFRAGAEAETNRITNNFRLGIMDLTQAMEQGRPQHLVQREAQKLYTQFIMNNPGLQDEADRIYGSMIGDNGIANIIKRGNESDRAMENITMEAYSNGYINFDGSNQSEGIAAWLTTKQQVQQLDSLKRMNETQQISDEQYNRQSIQAARELIPSTHTWVANRLELAAQEAATDPEAAIARLKSDYAKERSDVLSLVGRGVDINWLFTPFDNLITEFEQTADGTSRTEYLNKRIAETKAINNATYMADPAVARLVSAQELFGNDVNLLELGTGVLERAKNILNYGNPEGTGGAGNGSTPPVGVYQTVNPFDRQQETGYAFKFIAGKAAQIIEEGITDPAAIKEVTNNINSILQSVAEHKGIVSEPDQFDQWIEFITDENVSKFIVDNGIVVGSAVKETFQHLYQEKLLTTVTDEWESLQVYMPAPGFHEEDINAEVIQVPVSEVIEAFWNGVGVEFRAKPEHMNSIRVEGMAKRLNEDPHNSIARPLNRVLSMNATLNGTTDLKIGWDNDIGPRLDFNGDRAAAAEPTTPTAPSAEAPAPDLIGGSFDAIQENSFDQLLPQDWDGGPSVSLETLREANPEVLAQTLANPVTAVKALSSMSSPDGLTMADFNNDKTIPMKIIEQTQAADPAGMVNATSHMELATAFIGMNERDPQARTVLSQFFKETIGQTVDPAKTPWCAAFLNGVFNATGGQGTGSLAARSYLSWGRGVTDPQVGDVVVFSSSRGPASGHVGLFAGYDDRGQIKVLGGNQNNQVSIATYGTNRLLGFRRAL